MGIDGGRRLMTWGRIGRYSRGTAIQSGIKKKEEDPEGSSSLLTSAVLRSPGRRPRHPEQERRERRGAKRCDAFATPPNIVAAAFPGRWAGKRTGSVEQGNTKRLLLNVPSYGK